MISSVAGRLARAIIGTLLVAALANCGLKGDLYLPEPEEAATDQTRSTDSAAASNAVTTNPSEAATAADEDEKETVGKPSEGAPPQP